MNFVNAQSWSQEKPKKRKKRSLSRIKQFLPIPSVFIMPTGQQIH